MKILIIGSGYVGLVSGTCFAEMGHHVISLDIDADKIALLQQGHIPIYEPYLEEMIKRNMAAKRLHFTTDYAAEVPACSICIIAVDTPQGADGNANTSRIEAAAQMIGLHLQDYCVIVTKSTVPVGTSFLVQKIIKDELEKRQAAIDFDVVSNPEFLKEGNAIQDCMKPERVIIGSDNPRSTAIMKKLYSPFMLNNDRLLVMDIRSAELAKYASNAMLATRISFMNEMAALCEELGANINQVRKAMGADERIGNKFLYPGVGFGGSCFPKDIQALLAQGRASGVQLSLLQSVETVNQRQKKWMEKKLAEYFTPQGGISGKTIGILGLSFKPDTDDMREAPSLTLIDNLLKNGVTLRLFDPVAMTKAKTILPNSPLITWCTNELKVAENADAIVLMTEWKQFRFLDFVALLSKMRGKAFFDGRNQYQAEEMTKKGFDYICVGRQTKINGLP